MISTAGDTMNAPVRRPSCANASSSGAVRRRSSVAVAVVMRAVLTVPAMSPVVAPSGMRTSGLRGGAGAVGAAAAGFVVAGAGAVFDAVDDALPGVIGRPVVALMPGGVSESGAG